MTIVDIIRIHFMAFIHTIEDSIGIKPKMVIRLVQQDVVYQIFADACLWGKNFGNKPKVELK